MMKKALLPILLLSIFILSACGGGEDAEGGAAETGDGTAAGLENTVSSETTEEIAVYRLFNPRTGEHLFSSNNTEIQYLSADADWTNEGLAWNSPPEGAFVYRLVNPRGGHLITADEREIADLQSRGWELDNGANPAFCSGGNYGVYRLSNSDRSRHIFTANKKEYFYLSNNGWNIEGIAFNATSVPEGYAATNNPYASAEQTAGVESAGSDEGNANRLTEFSNALKAGEKYLDHFAFSKDGLYDQLLYSQFSEDAARYAVETISISWADQALRCANEYLRSMTFSKESLYNQLLYDRYTDKEARYAVDKLNTDWIEQATKKALGYLDILPYSKEDLFNQLLTDKFTDVEARAAVNTVLP